jgi:hypothetical protein
LIIILSSNKWDEFYKVWISDEVQDELAVHMENWCLNEAYYVSDGIKPTWNPRDDLWKYSRTDYHSQRMLDKANDYIDKNNSIKKFKISMANLGIKYPNDEVLSEAFFMIGFNEIENMFEPEPKTQEANILMMGANYLAEPLRVCAEIMFPEDQILVVENENGDDLTIIGNKKIIFDFNRQYHYVNGSEDQSPNYMKNEWKL